METVTLPYQPTLRRLLSYFQLAPVAKTLEEFGYFWEGHDASVGPALKSESLFRIGVDLPADAVFLFKHYDITVHPLQVIGHTQSCQACTYHYNIMLFHDYIGLENFFSV